MVWRFWFACVVLAFLCGPVRAREEPELPPEVIAFFQRLDELGRDKVEDAQLVRLTFQKGWANGWLLAQDEASITVLLEDLLPWTFNKGSETRIPGSWHPGTAVLKSVEEIDLGQISGVQESLMLFTARGSFSVFPEFSGDPSSHRLVAAHSAWKRGFAEASQRIVFRGDRDAERFGELAREAWKNLAWLHFLRGLGLLMYADRREVLPHLRLVSELDPDGEYAAQARDLVAHLERMVAEQEQAEGKAVPEVDESRLADTAKARLYVSQLKDLRCPQSVEPGFIRPYVVFDGARTTQDTPTRKLRDLGMSAAEALIEALDDDAPTRTVCHGRVSHRSRKVWRVSDFAWQLLRDITRKDFGYRSIVGSTLNDMAPAEKQAMITEIKDWYAGARGLSEEERMFQFFDSPESEDWFTAGEYFLQRKERRAVAPLVKKLDLIGPYQRGRLCELIGRLGDPSAIEPIRQVMAEAEHEWDKVSAAIALWDMGDDSGLAPTIARLKSDDLQNDDWTCSIWFLMHTRRPEAMAALEDAIRRAPPEAAAEGLRVIGGALSGGDIYAPPRVPAGSAEVAAVLMAAMDRDEPTDWEVNRVPLRVKDIAASIFVKMREGQGEEHQRVPTSDFAVSWQGPRAVARSEAERDAQMEELKRWYHENKDRLIWDEEHFKLRAASDPEGPG